MQINALSPSLEFAPMPKVGETTGAAGIGTGTPGVAPTEGKSFGQMLSDAISEVNTKQMQAADLTTRFAAGEPIDVHQVMIAGQEASVALNLAMQVRNKLTDAYQEIMRTSL